MVKQTLAKLSRPRQSGVFPRERLFKLLDDARQRPLVWISAPPGAGKTTLIASYVDQRKLACTWYQIDATDEDPATLFGALQKCIAKRGGELPSFSDDHNASLAAFSRRFFRQFISRLPAESMLVFDGLPELDSHSALTNILREAAQEIPAGSNLIVVSRGAPPAPFARLHLQQVMGELNWDALRLQPDETLAIATLTLGTNAQDIGDLHDRCDGWAAGLRLLVENYQRTGDWKRGPIAAERGALFGYFAAEIFDSLAKVTQEALIRTSIIPEVSLRAASTLTGDSTTWARLTELQNRHLFVDLLGESQPVLRYHALFREFLMAKARATLSPFELKALQREAATLLVAEGRVEFAVPLLTEAGEWSTASRLILEEASTMLARGHTRTLRSWVDSLPSWYVDATPRLLYCLGLAQSTSDPAAAMAALERAYQRFEAQRNSLGQALCAAAIIQAYYFRFDSYVGMERWASALDQLIRERLTYPSAETELHVHSMLQIALTYIEPGHPRLAHIAARVLDLVSRGLDVNQTVTAAGMLLSYYDWFAPDKANLLVGYVQPLLRSRDLTPFNRVWWLMAEVHHYYCAGEPKQLQNLISQIETLSTQHALRFSEAVTITLRLSGEIASDANKSFDEDLARATRALDTTRRQEELNLRLYAAEIMLSAREVAAGLAHAERGLELCHDTGLEASEIEALGLLAVALADSGRVNEALSAVRAARCMVNNVEPAKLEFNHLLIEAYAELHQDNHDIAQSLLRRAFAIAREQGHVKGYHWLPHMMAMLCAEALDAGIEVAYVHHIIRTRRLQPPAFVNSDAWPWPIQIFVLGRFEIQLGGQVLGFTNKAQKKPLELLKALVAKGSGSIEQSLIAQELWPDSEGDAAESAVRMAVHRLRKLLGNDAAILVYEGKLQINSNLCWVDAWAFENACRMLEPNAINPRQAPISPAKSLQVLRQYRGEAFVSEAVQPWMLAARDRWRSKFLRAVRVVGAAQETSADWDKAEVVYQSGLEADPLCEEFYQSLIGCYLKQGKTAEAYGTYRRCRDTLSITLGVKPSAKTEALRGKIAMQGAA